jgi:hypothetical protein
VKIGGWFAVTTTVSVDTGELKVSEIVKARLYVLISDADVGATVSDTPVLVMKLGRGAPVLRSKETRVTVSDSGSEGAGIE